jgi:hypothetical protein
MASEYNLDLHEILDKRETALVGREHGEETLKKCVSRGVIFEKIEKEYDRINIIVPENIVSINKSFFLGMFELAVIRLGKDIFSSKYVFKATEYIIQKIEKNIDAALLSASQGEILDVPE